MWERLTTGRINPQLNACFADEDFVRILCNVVQIYLRDILAKRGLPIECIQLKLRPAAVTLALPELQP